MYVIDSISSYEYKIKSSKFFSYIYKISELNECKNKLLELKKKYPDATHICYSYRLCSRNSFDLFNNPEIIEFSNDDGEPSGTAGKPILNSLRNKQIVDCAIFIVRFFGGKKLGIPGLIDAYRYGAFKVIEKVKLNEWFITKVIKIEFSYKILGVIEPILKKYLCKIIKSKYSDIIELNIELSIKDYDNIRIFAFDNFTQIFF